MLPGGALFPACVQYVMGLAYLDPLWLWAYKQQQHCAQPVHLDPGFTSRFFRITNSVEALTAGIY